LAQGIDRGVQEVAQEQAQLRESVGDLHQIPATLAPSRGEASRREQRCPRLQQRLEPSAEPMRQQMAVVMAAFVGGLLGGGEVAGLPQDDVDRERWFRLPKGHERRLHGHKHPGVRLVQEGATLMPVVEAHQAHPGPCSAAELRDYRAAQPPPDEQAAVQRRKVMRKARSQKKRQRLLADLEQRYLNCPQLFTGPLCI
jgi:hypothetical protein